MGTTWTDAHSYIKEDKELGRKVFSWTLWKYNYTPDFKKSDKPHKVTVLARATDNNGKVQNGKLEDMYNIRGLMNNAPHQLSFYVRA